MLNILPALAPVFGLIVLGFLLKRFRFPDSSFWPRCSVARSTWSCSLPRCPRLPPLTSSLELGGNARLMAAILTAQTLLAMVTMPLVVWVL